MPEQQANCPVGLVLPSGNGGLLLPASAGRAANVSCQEHICSQGYAPPGCKSSINYNKNMRAGGHN